MNFTETETADLHLLLQKEKKKINELDKSKVILFFTKCFKKTLSELRLKFDNLPNKEHAILLGSNLMFNVFWIVLNYSNNLKLTIFFAERSILLFIEFILLSNDPKINRELCYVPNIADALSFSYKKTVGSLTLESVCSYGRHLYLYNTTLIIKIVLQKHDDVDYLIDKICKISNSFANSIYFNKVYINISHLLENYEINVVDEYISKII